MNSTVLLLNMTLLIFLAPRYPVWIARDFYLPRECSGLGYPPPTHHRWGQGRADPHRVTVSSCRDQSDTRSESGNAETLLEGNRAPAQDEDWDGRHERMTGLGYTPGPAQQ